MLELRFVLLSHCYAADPWLRPAFGIDDLGAVFWFVFEDFAAAGHVAYAGFKTTHCDAVGVEKSILEYWTAL